MCGTRGEGFVFDFSAPRRRVSDEGVLEALRRRAAELGGRSFTMREFDAWAERPYRADSLRQRFGCWSAALERAGLRRVRKRRYSAEELVARLEEVWRARGCRPGTPALRKLAGVSDIPYKRHWGSVRRACELLARFHAGEITREALLKGEPRPARKAIPPKVRWAVMERDGFRCVVCGADPKDDPSVKLEVDHRDSVAAGGGDGEENLCTMCRRCNRGKGKRKWAG